MRQKHCAIRPHVPAGLGFRQGQVYFLCGIKGWKFDHDTFRLTPVLLDGSDGPVFELREMYERFKSERAREA